MGQDVPPAITAGELLEQGRCSAPCLLAMEGGPCTCRCRGCWHGVLSGVVVHPLPASAWYDAWDFRWSEGTQIEGLDLSCPVISSSSARAAAVRDYRRHRSEFAITYRTGASWETRAEAGQRTGGGGPLGTEAATAMDDLLDTLLRRRRLNAYSAAADGLFAYGVRTKTEAQAIGAIFCDATFENLEALRACRAALS